MFEDVLDECKSDITENLVAFGEAHRVHKAVRDLEANRKYFLRFYEEGMKEGEKNIQGKLDKILAILQQHHIDVECTLSDEPIVIKFEEVASEIEGLLK